MEMPAELMRLANGHFPIHIREAVSGIEDVTSRKGCLQAALTARYGHAEDLAKILVTPVL